MSLTPSTMLPLGTPAPDFSLPDTDGRVVSRVDYVGGKGLLVAFICNHCPYVKHLNQALATLGDDLAKEGLSMVAISSNDVANYPDDSPDLMVDEKARWGYRFPYLYDETQDVAKAYRAACTPDFFLFDADLRLAYRGQFDDSRPGNDVQVTGRDLRSAIAAVLHGHPPHPDQRPSLGCNIKWKPGNEPSYFG